MKRNAFILSLLLFIGVNAFAQDPAQVSPEYYRVLHENKQLRILEMRLPPGARDDWHEHPEEVVIFTKGGKLSIELSDGATIVKKVKEGDVMPHEAWTHRVSNVGPTEVVAIIVEQKPTN